MKILTTLLGCGLLVLLSAMVVPAHSIQTDYDRSYNLAKLRTYSFIEHDRGPIRWLPKFLDREG